MRLWNAGAMAAAVVLGTAALGTVGSANGVESGAVRSASDEGIVDPRTGKSPLADVGDLHSLKTQRDRIKAFGRTVAEIIGMEVEDLTGQHVGDVIDVFANAKGDIAALAVEVGGFLGIGAKIVMLPTTALQVDTNHFITAMSLAEVKELSKHRH